VRFLHTSDWHLGRNFFGVSLLEDQAHVLHQLVLAAVEAKVDAVLLAGDVYDRSAPPADAVAVLDDTLTRLVIEHGIPVVLIAGNHDSGERLDFGSRLLTSRGLHVAGTAPRVISFEDRHGPIEVVAVPFCEPAAVRTRHPDLEIGDHDAALRADLPGTGAIGSGPPADPGLAAPGRPTLMRRRVAVAHAFVSGGTASESERPLVMGNAALVAADCFDGFAYAALGHLHRPQRVGRDEVRYSGSLLKYSFDEAAHRKSVSVVDLGGDGECRIEELELTARRDVRVLEGTLEELQRAASGDRSRDDYLFVRLTDRGAVLDSIGKLRLLYPNCLRVDHQAWFAARGNDAAARVDLRSHSETELFDAFFREVTGEGPGDDEAHAFADALAAVRRTDEQA